MFYKRFVSFASFVKRIRRQTGMKQVEFADALHVIAPTVSDWERDVADPKLENLERMVKLVDPKLTLSQCLVLPFEASESERKYRAIVEIMSGVSLSPQPAKVPIQPEEITAQPQPRVSSRHVRARKAKAKAVS